MKIALKFQIIFIVFFIMQLIARTAVSEQLCTTSNNTLKQVKKNSCELVVQTTVLKVAANCSGLALGAGLNMLNATKPSTIATLAKLYPKIIFGGLKFLNVANIATMPFTIWSVGSVMNSAIEADKKCYENIELKTAELTLMKFNSEMIIEKIPNIKNDPVLLWTIKFPNEYLSESFVKNLTCQRLKEIAEEQRKKIDPIVGKALASKQITQDPRKEQQLELQEVQKKLLDQMDCWPVEKKMDVICTLGNTLLMAKSVMRPGSPQLSAYEKDLHEIYADAIRAKNFKLAEKIDERTLTLLKTEKIIGTEFIGKGISGAKVVKLENGTEGIWKKATDSLDDRISAASEVSAYKLDRYLGLNTVPATTMRVVDGELGSLQLKVSGGFQKTKEDLPEATQMFDYLTNNWDRNKGNYFVRKSGQIVNIDHGVAFGVEEYADDFVKTSQKILKDIDAKKITAEAAKSQLGPLFVNQNIVQKLRDLNPKKMKDVLGNNLTAEQMAAMESRRQTIIKYAEIFEKKVGKDFYPQGDYSSVFYSN